MKNDSIKVMKARLTKNDSSGHQLSAMTSHRGHGVTDDRGQGVISFTLLNASCSRESILEPRQDWSTAAATVVEGGGGGGGGGGTVEILSSRNN
ncbi:hypothetical protein ElyMa_002089100 [Elysia marginata]|uniref:Uncharacterized protein n=1 Tax=Elysia marginata TaxID=1093978 RepID=A0AAV4FCP2_9GAST|nr:hypothetical protein ElyMa_002089100 [Elysia marginata]